MTLGTAAINNTGSITNTGNLLTITGNLGANVTGVTQNSATGTTTLSGTNTAFAGPVTLTAGTLKLSTATALGGNGTTTGTGGTLTLGADTTIDTTSSTTVTLTTVNAQTWNGDFTYGGTGSLTFGSGAVTLKSNVQLTNNGTGRNLIVGGAVTSTGTGNLTLKNTSTGATTFSGAVNHTGTLTFTGTGTGAQSFTGGIGSNVGNILNSSAGAVTLGLTTGVTVGNIIGNTGTITNEGTGSGSFTINGALDSSVTSLIQNSATSKMVVLSTTGTVGTFISGTGSVNILAGTFQSAGNGGSSIVFGSGNVFTLNSGATWEINNTNPTIAGINDGVDGGGSITNLFTASSKVLSLKGSGNYSFSGGIANSSGTAVTGVTVALTGSGQQTFAGDHTYTGATTISLGKLILSNNGSKGSLAGTVVTVAGPSGSNNNGATITSTAGNSTLLISGNYSIGTATTGTLNIAGGNGTTTSQGTLSLIDGTVNTLKLLNDTTTAASVNQTFAFGGATTGNAMLNIELGAAGSDKIVVGSGTAKMYVGNGGGDINITGLGGLTGAQSTVIEVAGGMITGISGNTSNLANLTLGTTSGNFSGYQVAIGNTATTVFLTQTANAAAANAYYNGAASAVTAQGGTTAWNSFVNGNTNTSNFGTGAGGSGNANGQLGASTNVFFDTNVAAPLSTTLGQNTTINSLTLNTANAVAIGGAHTLTLNATSANGNASGNGLTVSTGSGNHTLGTKVALANNQSWTVTDSSSTLTANNEISGSGSLTKLGAGILSLSGANTYSGGTTISSGSLIVNNTTGSGTGSGALFIASGASLGGSGTIGGAATVNGSLNPGNSPGVMTFNAGLTLGSSATTHMQIAGGSRGTQYDGVNVSGGSLTYGGILAINFSSSTVSGTTYDLFNLSSGSPSGSFSSVSIAGTYAASLTHNSGVWTGSNGGYDFSFTESTGDLSILASAIPEPSSAAALAALAAGLTAVVIRRRSRLV